LPVWLAQAQQALHQVSISRALRTGLRCRPLADTLAAHAEVDALWWPAATAEQCRKVEALSVSNLKRTWVGAGAAVALGDPRTLLEQAVQVKNVWVPYGV
jgi:aldehyde dehydrogenase (NAD+)